MSTFFLGSKELQLKDISSSCKFCEYNPHKFAAATLRIQWPRTTALIFGSGNLVCTGAKTVNESLFACRQAVNILQRSGLNVSFLRFKTQLVVGTAGTYNLPIDLVKLQHAYGTLVRYEPGLFPGLVYRLPNPKIVFLLFRSGKVVITGAKTERQLYEQWNLFYQNVLIDFLDTNNDMKCSAEYRTMCEEKEFSIDYFHSQMNS